MRVAGWNSAVITGDNIPNFPSVQISGVIIDQDTELDINITNPTTIGHIDGYVPYLKLFINPSSTFFVTGKDRNIITVAKRGGDFSSIGTAITSITDASSVNNYIISVGPGIYVENPIILPSYIAIVGSGSLSTIIYCDNPTGRAITGSDASEIRLCAIAGASGPGGVGVYYEGTGLNQPFVMSLCASVITKPWCM